MNQYKLAHRRILQEQKKLEATYSHMPLAGKNTRADVVKRVREEMQEMSFRLARECNILVNYPKLSIQGSSVVLGEVRILLPSGRYVGYEELKQIELNAVGGGQK